MVKNDVKKTPKKRKQIVKKKKILIFENYFIKAFL